jgi:sulfite reductase (NADPH) flavoprotein alpha-component
MPMLSTSEVDEVRYFAYGANMNPNVFVQRRRFRPLSTERATLSGYELLFAARGMTFLEPVFAALRPVPDGCVHGVLYRLRREEADRLHRLENGYDRLAIDVRGVQSSVVAAYTYNIPELTHGLLPSRRYLRLLCDGARAAGLPNGYVESLVRHPSKYFPILSPLAAAVVQSRSCSV